MSSQTTRTLLTIVTEAALEVALGEDVERLGAHGYTVADVRGKGSRGYRGVGWEESRNIRMDIVCDRATAETIAEHVRSHYYDNYAMVLFMNEVEVLRPQKF